MKRILSYIGNNSYLRLLASNKKRGFLGLLTLTVSIIVGGFFFFTSWFSGFLIARYLSAKEVGERSKLPSVILPAGRFKFHLHHWFICSVAIIVTVLRGCWFLPSELLEGFLGGIALQGVYYYNDWHKIIKRK